MKKIRLSQTTIKILNRNHCPKLLKQAYFDRSIIIPPSSAMEKGIYAETKMIGSGAYDQQLHDLPRLKSGDRSAEHKRIDQQVDFFKNVILEQYKMNTDNVQVEMECDYNDEVTLTGNMDMVTPFEDDALGYVPIAIVDLKLTGSIYNQYGDFCWAFPANMDHTQATAYTILFEKNFGSTVPFYYIVMDFKTDPEFKVIRKKVGTFERSELNEMIRLATEKVNEYEQEGYKAISNEQDCKRCPLKNECEHFSIKKEIEVI